MLISNIDCARRLVRDSRDVSLPRSREFICDSWIVPDRHARVYAST